MRIGIGAKLINATRVINMNVGDERAIKSRHAVAQRLLAQVHARINNDAALRDTVEPLHKHRTAQTAVALITREADATATTDARHATACP